MAAAASLNHAFERASHQASGVATMSSESVVIAASSIVSLIGIQISGGMPSTSRSVQRIAEPLDDRARLRPFEKLEERLGRLAVRAGLEQHRVLPDRRVEFGRNLPARPCGD